MKKHLLYGLLYIVLLPAALFQAFMALILLLAALQVPVLLLPLFIVACFAIYTISSLVFYVKAVQQQRSCKPVLRDWIRINAFVIVIPTVMLLMESISVMIKPDLLIQGIEQMKSMQQNMPLPESTMVSVMRFIFYLILVYAAAMLVHIPYTFRLLRQYKYAFGRQDG